jgi:hypothetical protein
LWYLGEEQGWSEPHDASTTGGNIESHPRDDDNGSERKLILVALEPIDCGLVSYMYLST